MPQIEAASELALDLYAEWEERVEAEPSVSVEEVCADHPALLPKVLEIASRMAPVPGLSAIPFVPLVTAPPAEPAADARRWTKIGQGASSVVYRGWDAALGTTVAYKVLSPHDQPLSPDEFVRLMKRFELEARILARLKHEGIVRIFRTFLESDRSVLEMEYLPGGSLAEKADDLRRAGPGAIARFVERVVQAVGFAHRHGIVHRDLKPSNILLDENGQPCVSDFGIAKLLGHEQDAQADGPPDAGDPNDHEALTRLGQQPGTRAYMAPEQFDPAFGSITSATDIWALGVILYELLVGELPFAGPFHEHARELVCRAPLPTRPNPQLDATGRRLLRVAQRCLRKDPAERYWSADQLAKALRQAAAPRRGRIVLAGLSLALAAGLGLAAFNGLGPRTGPTAAWHDSQEVRDALAKLGRGERAVLIGDGKTPDAYTWPRGPESGRRLTRGDGLFTVYSAQGGGCLVELLPHLPPGRFRIDAEVLHETAEGMSWVGLYAAASHTANARGRHHLLTMVRYADLGWFARDEPREPGVTHNRRTHLAGLYLGDSERDSVASYQEFAKHPGEQAIEAPPRGWRHVSLVIDGQSVAATQQGVEPVGQFGTGFLDRVRAASLECHPDLQGLNWPARVTGGVGFYVCKGTASLRSLEITPLLP